MDKNTCDPFDLDIDELRAEVEIDEDAFEAEMEQAEEMELVMRDVMTDTPYFLGDDPDEGRLSSDYRYEGTGWDGY